MRDDCIQAVTQAAGRALTSSELKDIESRILRAARLNAREDRQTTAKQSPAERVQAAAERAATEIQEEANRNVRNVARQIIAHDRNMQFIERYGQAVGGKLNALRRLIGDNLDQKANIRSLEQRRNGIVRSANASLQDIADYTQKYLGFWTNKDTQLNVIKELFGEHTGDAHAKYVADRWSETAESLRTQFNESGGAVRKLAGWAIPQSHSMFKVFKSGVDAWTDFVLPRLNREMYVREDGSLMDDAEIKGILQKSWDSITTDGVNALQPGVPRGTGSIRNRGQDARVVHFKDGQSYAEYQTQFGERSLLETMAQHITTMGKNIATLETFGPQGEAGFRTLLDTAYQSDRTARRGEAGKVDKNKSEVETQFNLSSGKMGAMADPTLAHKFDIAKTLIILPKLGSATLSAVTDGANVRMVARAWQIPAFQKYLYTLKAWGSGDYRADMRANGVGVESITHSISRFGEDAFGHGLPSVLANTLFRVSGLNLLDNIRRTATGGMLMRKLGDLVSSHETMTHLDEHDRALLESRGVNEATWGVWKQAQLSNGLLTMNGIKQIAGVSEGVKRDALQHLVGSIFMDEGTVVPMMKDWARASVAHQMGAAKRGTWGGELANSILQFKSFPLAMISNHWQRMMSMPTTAGKAMYATELAVTATILGALSVQMKSLASGYNPQDMTDAKFAARAFIQGGAGGILGDTILNAAVSPHKEHITDQLGPLISELGNLYELGQAGVHTFKDPNKQAQFGDAAVRFMKANTPFANLWYTKAATDRLFFQRLQDYFSPGYSARQIERSKKDYNNTPWWAPSTAASPGEIATGSMRGVTAPQTPTLQTAAGGR
jgi:hypothetical protein